MRLIAKLFFFVLCFQLTAENLVIDRLDNELVTSFYRTDIKDGSTVPDSTKVSIGREHDYLYFTWVAHFTEPVVKGQFTSEDVMPDADFLRVQIITTPEDPFSYSFYAFPLGNRYDEIRNKELSTDSDWDSNYSYTTEIKENKWHVTMKIPFSDLRFSGSAPYNWKLILTRYYENEESYYSYPRLKDTISQDYFNDAADITVTKPITRRKVLSVKPYTIFNYNMIREELEDTGWDNTGFDISLKPHSTTKLKLSINPDFSDVPLDNAIDTSNLKYAPSFSENRYFFIEDFDAFGVGTGLFYSRNIVQPEIGIKGTVKTDNLAVSMLFTEDKGIYTIDDYGDEETIDDDSYFAGSLKYIGKKFNLTNTFLLRNAGDWHNEVYHISPNYEFKNLSLYTNLDLSAYSADDLDDTDYGYYGKIGFDYWKNNTEINFYVNKMSDDFTAEMGNLEETDFYSYQFIADKLFPVNQKLVKSYSTNFFSEYKRRNDDDLMYRNLRLKSSVNFQSKLSLSFNALWEQEKHNGKVHDVDYLETEINYRRHQSFSPVYLLRYAHVVHYDRNRVYPYVFQRLGCYSRLTSHILLSGYVDNYQYLDFTKRRLYSGYNSDESIYIIEDSNFLVGNIDASINASNNVTFKIGYRHNGNQVIYETVNNETGEIIRSMEYSSDQGIYANLTIIIKKLNIYLGYRSSFYEYNSENTKNYENIYLKLSCSL
jgi:hypothetical protein